jgi:predicted nucleic acid-binding protein
MCVQELWRSERRWGVLFHSSTPMIAAIAASRGGAVATRNVRDFEHCGIEVVNPWDA